MLKVSRKISVTLSLVLAFIVGIGGVVGAFFMPAIVEKLIDTRNVPGSIEFILPDSFQLLLFVLAYVALVCILCADVLMILQLLRVRNGKVFTKKSVSYIRGVSWCCMLFGVTFAAIGLYFFIGFVVSGLAFFLGLCLRVVKNVIEEATAIKSENDLTV